MYFTALHANSNYLYYLVNFSESTPALPTIFFAIISSERILVRVKYLYFALVTPLLLSIFKTVSHDCW